MPPQVYTQHNNPGCTGAEPEETVLNTLKRQFQSVHSAFSRAAMTRFSCKTLIVPKVKIGAKGRYD